MAGKVGEGLQLQVSARGPRAYALLAVGLGSLDLTNHSRLCFWIKGNRGGEDVVLHLRAGDKRPIPVRLSEYGKVTQSWQRMCIDRGEFGTHLLGHPATQLVFAWEGGHVGREIILLDEIVFE